MSVTEIAGRISQIQAQLSLLAPVRTSSAGAFATALQSASGTSLTTDPTTTATLGAGQDTGVGADLGSRAVEEARTYLGMPYVWGGDSPSDGGMDCSGLVQHVYGDLGIDLPRVSRDQAQAGTAVASMADARPGDLLAWDNSSRNVGADHIAIYVGDGKMIEAPRTGLDIRLVDVPSTPDYIRRVAPDPGTAVGAATSTRPSVAGLGDVPFRSLFESAGQRYGVDPVLLSSVARQESGFDPRAVSHAGAQGLMQLMPGTAAGLGVSDPFDPPQAVDGAARLLRQLLDRFDGRVDLALAGYNAGPGAVDRYHGVPPYPETRNYVRSVMAMMEAA
ncbi:lytic transglycosylase domain-containing protein [Nocardioides rubriscoriae]|uniref:lytic transglycosylase domain-containing protein n=1 Tax=Nocardioides rubriscoriae TaxID=642762 RepID=UPI0011DF617E|nr:lytic transglycosylase domain-containing protein [Nocardioides rubriscoriae]